MEGFAHIVKDDGEPYMKLVITGLPAKFAELSLEELAMGIGKSIEAMNGLLETWEKEDGAQTDTV